MAYTGIVGLGSAAALVAATSALSEVRPDPNLALGINKMSKRQNERKLFRWGSSRADVLST